LGSSGVLEIVVTVVVIISVELVITKFPFIVSTGFKTLVVDVVLVVGAEEIS